MLSTLAGWAAYLLIAFIWWTQIYKMLYRAHMKEFGETLGFRDGDRLFGVFWGGFVAFFWPVSFPIFLMGYGIKVASRRGLFSHLEKPLSRLEK